jgi:cytochrome P450
VLCYPAVWEKPHVFDPLRFDNSGKTGAKEKYHRFGLGARRCLGQTYADQILKIGVGKIVSKYRFHLDAQGNNQKLEHRTTIANLAEVSVADNVTFVEIQQ